MGNKAQPAIQTVSAKIQRTAWGTKEGACAPGGKIVGMRSKLSNKRALPKNIAQGPRAATPMSAFKACHRTIEGRQDNIHKTVKRA
mmetsp:Transcript_130442/g.225541  ORF Transcript_130442/g.225541 Transcript_130442/m.225541 type:complete len:86 (+) Transcript_130442:493-750(+)